MPPTDSTLGIVAPGFRAHYWFGRPLLLSARTARYSEKAQLINTINEELALGCDGFLFPLGSKLTAEIAAEQMAVLDDVLRAYSQKAIIYIEVKATAIDRSLLDLLRSHKIPGRIFIGSRYPNALLELWRFDPDPSLQVALIVETDEGFSGLNHCPYRTVDVTNVLANHKRIRQIHGSMKEVFVRVTLGKKDAGTDGKGAEKVEKRIRGLKPEKVDAVISDQTALLTSLGLGAGTQPTLDMPPTAE